MKRDYKVPLAVQMAADIAHGKHMMGGLLELTLKPGVLDAVAAANERA